MDKVRKTLLAAVPLLLAGLLAACGQAAVRLGWVEISSPGHLAASYIKFTGTETRTVPAQAGETLFLEYGAKVDTGDLTVWRSRIHTARPSGASSLRGLWETQGAASEPGRLLHNLRPGQRHGRGIRHKVERGSSRTVMLTTAEVAVRSLCVPWRSMSSLEGGMQWRDRYGY